MANQRNRDDHGLTALRVVGGLLPPEFLQTVARLQAAHQNGTDYGLSKSLALKDELARYWRIANDLYAGYLERRDRAGLDRSRVGVDEWLVPLIKTVFGYEDLASAHPATIGDRTFRITHQALEKTVPVALTVREVDLDRADPRFGDDVRRRAAHGVMQDLLNADDSCLWGLISNGVKLRLLRDNPTLTRPAYIEADLERIFDEQLYADFTTLWLAVHASRLKPVDRKPSGCILEAWRRQAHEIGERALEHLRDGVTSALRALGGGFLQHPQNEPLRVALSDGSLSTDSYFEELLRLVYRLLFLFAAEERHLLQSLSTSDEERALYEDGYALARLRDRALRRRHYDRHSDLWQGLQIVFAALATGARPLGLPALGGLFSADQCKNLDGLAITNEALLESIHAVAYFRSGAGLVRINYRDMGTEELGSVYESLLELQPCLDVNASPWTFGFVGEESGEKAKGSARKLTGSYYTPAFLVNELVKTALEPVMTQAIAERSEDPRSALLELKIVDPACGSGHFLLAAARRMAAEVARIEVGSDTPDEAARQRALREVVQHSIYGVDRNPLAVELCKTALWIETVDPGKPLTFLDPHIQCGDSLVGILDPGVMAGGIPDEAYKPLAGDDVAVCRNLRGRNRRAERSVQGDIFDQGALNPVAELSAALDEMPEDTLDEIAAKRVAWETGRRALSHQKAELRANLFVGAFFATKTLETVEYVPITEDLNRLDPGLPMRAGVDNVAADLAERYRFFHWHIGFAEIMQRGGFDVILGNPPWERVKLYEQEFFASRSPLIANAPGKAARDRLIRQLGRADASAVELSLLESFSQAKHVAEATAQFASSSNRFPLTGVGDINTYGLFAELFKDIVSPRGRAGLIAPTDLLTGDALSGFFRSIISGGILKSSLAFENEEFIFPGIANVNRFALITLGARDPHQEEFTFAFYLRRAEHLSEIERFFSLNKSDLRLLNPNTETCPAFRSVKDANLTKEIYARVPVFIDDTIGPSGNPWGVSFMRMFDMSNDSQLFRTAAEFASTHCERDGADWIDAEKGKRYVPLYEGKFTWFYDYRFSSYHNVGKAKGRGGRGLPPVSVSEYTDHEFGVEPRYWVSEDYVTDRLRTMSWMPDWLIAWRDVSSAKLERTMVPCPIPRSGVGNTLSLLFSTRESVEVACLLGNLSSLPLDYFARQKTAGTHLSQTYLKQFPVLAPDRYRDADREFIIPRVVELSYTSHAMHAFAHDLGYDGSPFVWDPERRARLCAELDAYYSRLYGLSRDDLRYILEPADVYGKDYPSETFRVLNERETSEFQEYRTGRLVLEAWDELAKSAVLA